MSPAGGWSSNSTVRNADVRASWVRRLSSNVPCRSRSWRIRSRSTSVDRAARAVGEALGLGEQVAALVDHRLAVPRQVRGGLALTGGREDVRRRAARARAAHQQSTVLGAGHRDRAAGQVRQHGRASQRGLGARRDRHPHVLADLDVQPQPGDVGGREDQVGTERHLDAVQRDRAPPSVVPGREPAALVELAVGRQVGLRAHAEHPAPVDHHGAVQDAGAVHERGTDDDDRGEVRRPGHDLGDRGPHGVEQGVLEHQVVDGVAGQRQLGEHRDRDAVVVAGAGLLEHGAGVGRRVGDRDRDGAGRDPGEPVGVGGVEVHVFSVPRGDPARRRSTRVTHHRSRRCGWWRAPSSGATSPRGRGAEPRPRGRGDHRHSHAAGHPD